MPISEPRPVGQARPARLWFNGELVDWADGVVHVWTECATRGANVFEGLRAYWDPARGGHRVVAVEDHMNRLIQSARLLRLPAPAGTTETMICGMRSLLMAEIGPADAYLRPTLYLEEGRFGRVPKEVRVGNYVVAVPLADQDSRPTISLATSRWRRIPEDCFPARIKTGAAYQPLRLATLEARDRGADDALLLDGSGCVTETPGAALLMVRAGRVVAPPTSSGVLESITRAIVLGLLRSDGFDVETRPIGRSELDLADELIAVGTLASVQAVTTLDAIPVGSGEPGQVTERCRRLYQHACRHSAFPPPWVSVWPLDDDRNRRAV